VSAAGPSLSSARDRVGSCGTLAVTTYEHAARAALQPARRLPRAWN